MKPTEQTYKGDVSLNINFTKKGDNDSTNFSVREFMHEPISNTQMGPISIMEMDRPTMVNPFEKLAEID